MIGHGYGKWGSNFRIDNKPISPVPYLQELQWESLKLFSALISSNISIIFSQIS